jgi:peptidoglycan/xylan/chitin deacetylase (PgdA/CDA1 family)
MMRMLVVAFACVALAACGGSEATSERSAEPAPRVTLSAGEQARWAPGPADRSRVPVLVYPQVAREDFARQMTLLEHAGYRTITLDTLARFVRGEQPRLPPRPVLLTIDGGRLDSWRRSDAILRELGFNAVQFVSVGPIEEGNREYLSWKELDALQRSGRWDVQLQSGTGDPQIQYGPDADDVGPFYAYRGSHEVLGGWRERVFSDISYGEQQLAHHVRGYRPLGFAPPYGNYGQAGTNDRRIPSELLARLLLSFELIFVQDRTGFARSGADNPLGRIEVTQGVSDEQLRAMLGN